MKRAIEEYSTLVFDCDGVVLNSNHIKTDAFYHAAKPYGHDQAQALVDYHRERGGISRYRKFEHFAQHIVPGTISEEAFQQLLTDFADYVREGLLQCEVAPGLERLRKQVPESRWLIVSGGDQSELRSVFKARGLAQWFDGGIFGSPDAKEAILQRELAHKNILQPALFLGDSKYDFTAANSVDLDFVFLTDWSEVADADDFCRGNRLTALRGVSSFLKD